MGLSSESILKIVSSRIPIIKWMPSYSFRDNLASDIVAGITVACMLIPQGMAYAKLALVPVQYGLYSSIIPLFVYAMFGTSRQLAIGPTATSALVVGSIVSQAVPDLNPEDSAQVAILSSFFVGLILFLLSIFRLGVIASFLSSSVLLGFSSGAAITIMFSQLGSIFGFPIPKSPYPIYSLYYALANIAQTNPYSITICIVSVVILLILKRAKQETGSKIKALTAAAKNNLPGQKKSDELYIRFLKLVNFLSTLSALLVVIISALVCSALVNVYGVPEKMLFLVGVIPSGFPVPAIPNFSGFSDKLGDILSGSFIVAILVFMESWSSTAKMADTYKYRDQVNANQELLALGLMNFIGSFTNSFPVSGGFSRTAVNAQSGAKSQLAAILCALLILLGISVAVEAFYYIPAAALAAIVLIAVSTLIDFGSMARAWRVSKPDFLVSLATLLATIILGPSLGILIGLCTSLVAILQVSAFPHIAVLGKMKINIGPTDTKIVFRNLKRFKEATPIDGVAIVRIDAPLWFGNVDAVISRCLHEAEGKELFILDASAMAYIDISGLNALSSLENQLKKSKCATFAIVNANGPVRDALLRYNQSFQLPNQIGVWHSSLRESPHDILAPAANTNQRHQRSESASTIASASFAAGHQHQGAGGSYMFFSIHDALEALHYRISSVNNLSDLIEGDERNTPTPIPPMNNYSSNDESPRPSRGNSPRPSRGNSPRANTPSSAQAGQSEFSSINVSQNQNESSNGRPPAPSDSVGLV